MSEDPLEDMNAPPPEDGAFISGATLRPDPSALVTMIRAVRADAAEPANRASPGSGPHDSSDRFADFELTEEIGRGGTAVVFRARQRKLGREVAIKRITARNAVSREKFLVESRVTAVLDHPGIVPIYDLVASEGDDAALAMKLVRGTSWKDLLHHEDGGARRDLDFHLGVLLSVSNAVAFAHSKGIGHHDLKPANVMVGEFGEVLVVDWGLAFDLRDEPDEASVAPHKSALTTPSGTPAYWAPELAKGRGKAIGPWTDVYLLGAILYEIGCGRPPHGGGSLFTTISQAVKSDPPAFEPGAPAGIEAICRKAMARAPADRYPTVAAFQEALRAFMKNRESLRISAEASELLRRAVGEVERLVAADGADRRRIYGELSEAAMGFRQALVLWSENEEAIAGERRASLALARLALDNGDLGLAEEELSRRDPSDADAAALTARLRETITERARAKRNASRMRWGLAAATSAIVVGLTVGLFVIRAEHRRSEASAALARERLTDIRRLADIKRLADYTAEADDLWPALPDKAAAMDDWLSRARALAGQLPSHRAHLASLRRGAAPPFRFAGAEEQWEHDTLEGLVAGLDALEKSLIPSMERRVALARTVRARTLEGPREAWQRAVASIADPADSPRYHGLHITPQLGLIPLGRDAASGLWEFVHVPSGDVPERGPDGKLVLTEAMGVVLVLIPGGTFAMGTMKPDALHKLGSPNVDVDARAPEQPVHTVTLGPFFMGKYEFTQGQWVRANGANPSAYPGGAVISGRRHTLLHPVEQVGWKEIDRTFSRLGLRFATEAQWEYAARGGTSSIYFTGDAKASLQGAANLADRYCKENGGPGSWPFELSLDDGFVVHGPVGSLRPNGFGLHDTAGNVWEFVQDHYGSYDMPLSPGDGERQVPTDSPRVFRGGGFRSNAVHARSADRYSLYAPDFRGFDIGARAARSLDP